MGNGVLWAPFSVYNAVGKAYQSLISLSSINLSIMKQTTSWSPLLHLEPLAP